MFDRLEDILIHFEELQAELSNPEVINDQKRFRRSDEGAERSDSSGRGLPGI